ncbi:MAG: YfhO family protein [Deltaproteobacteria bacterium]|nr:YfhO family protein [Deltaproteobacteria bacterium]
METETDFRRIPRRRLDFAVPCALYLALLLFIFHRVFFPGSERQEYFGWDTLASYWPDFAYRFRAIWRGEFPLWNPYELGGYPFALHTQNMLFYPPSWLLAAFALPHGRLSVWGIQYLILFHFLVIALGAHFLARRLGAGKSAAFLAGITAVLCAPVLNHRNSMFLYPLAWLPWLLLVIDRFLDNPNRKTALGVSVVGILAGSAANPPGVFDVVWTCGVFAAASLPLAVGTNFLRQDRAAAVLHVRRLIVWGTVAFVLVLSYLAITYLPSLDLFEQSTRAGRGAGYNFDRALRFEHLQSLFIARKHQSFCFDLFVGISTLIALGPALLIKPDRRVWILAGISFLSVWVAIGEEGGLLRTALDHLPGFTLNRKAYRYAAVFGILSGPLAARGVSMVFAVVRTSGAGRRFASFLPTRVYAASTLLVSSALVLHFAPGVPLRGKHEAILAAQLVPWETYGVCFLLWVCLAIPRLGSRMAPICLFVIGATLAAHLHWSASVRLALNQPLDLALERQYMKDLPTTSTNWRLGIEGPRLGIGSRELLRYAGGYKIPVELGRHRSFMSWTNTNPERLRLFNVRFLLSEKNPGKRSKRIRNALWELENPVPLIAHYSAVRRIPDGKALAQWGNAEKLGVALVESGDWISGLDDLKGARGKRTAGKVTKYSSNSITASVKAGTWGLAVVNEVYFPGWRASVDGRESPVIRCNHLLRGVVVGPGRHRIVLRYWPPSYGWLCMLLLFSVLGCTALAIDRLWERAS